MTGKRRRPQRAFVARGRLLVLGAALLVGALVWGAGRVQLRMADGARQRQVAVQQLLTSMLDQETSVRGFLLTGQRQFLQPYREGVREYADALARARASIESGRSRAALERSNARAVAWRRSAVSTIGGRRAPAATGMRKQLMADYRSANLALQAVIEHDRARAANRMQTIWTAGALLVVVLLAYAGDALVIRRARDERRHKDALFEFREAVQRTTDTRAASDCLREHVQAGVPASEVVVLGVDGALGLLTPWTPGAVGTVADGKRPGACLGLRRGETHLGSPPCEVCGDAPGAVRCHPLQVGGESVGAVVVVHDAPLARSALRRLRDSIAASGPVLANLRNLERARAEASTDALTGLPNRRALEAALGRMLVAARNAGQPLAALMVDLDHFKRLNDEHGHDAGDEALAQVGAVLARGLRANDVAGRLGGEEFLVLAAGIDAAGTQALAEKLRRAIAGIPLSVDATLSASIGFALDDGGEEDPSALIKAADDALYAAKRRGRNRVEQAR